MDQRFREDENELPYLLWEKRDSISNSKSRSNNESLDDIFNSMDLPLSERMILEDKLVSFLNAKDCVDLTVEDDFYACNFIFTRKNEYVATIDIFEYSMEFSSPKRIFLDSYSSHDHSNLVKNPRFRDLIKKTGMEFIKCSGGYVTEYSGADDVFTMKDEIDVGVYFKVGSETRLYKLDLDRMELSESYFKYI